MPTPPAVSRRLGWLPGRYAVTLAADGEMPGGAWLALVRGPEGLTVVRPATPDDPERWAALSEATPHGLDVPGMLAAVVGPVAAAGVPVFVTSTYDADLVLVPEHRRADAADALRRSGIAVDPVDPTGPDGPAGPHGPEAPDGPDGPDGPGGPDHPAGPDGAAG